LNKNFGSIYFRPINDQEKTANFKMHSDERNEYNAHEFSNTFIT